MTLSLAAVFIPLLFMGGIIGKLFNEFAVTIIVSILVSGFVSLTLTPMLCSRFLKPTPEGGHGPMYAAFERGFQAALQAYERSLGWVMRHRPLTLVFSVLILVLTGVLFQFVPKGLFPADDTGQLMATTEAAQGTSYDAMVRLQGRAAQLLEKDPNVLKFMSALGGNGSAGATNQGVLFITLKSIRPNARRRASSSPRSPPLSGSRAGRVHPEPARDPDRRAELQGAVSIHAAEQRHNELYASALKLVAALQKLRTVTNVTTDLLNTNPTGPPCRSIASAPGRWASRHSHSRTRSPKPTTNNRPRRSTPRPTSTGSCSSCSPSAQRDMSDIEKDVCQHQ